MMSCFEYHVKISKAVKWVTFLNHLYNYQPLKDDYEFVLLGKLITYLRYNSVTFITVLFMSISKSRNEKRSLILITCQDLG